MVFIVFILNLVGGSKFVYVLGDWIIFFFIIDENVFCIWVNEDVWCIKLVLWDNVIGNVDLD